MEKLLKRAADYRLLFESIKDGKTANVEDFLMLYPNDKFAYNAKNESALASALKHKRLRIYELLLSQNFSFGPHEKFEEIIKEMSGFKRWKLREIHRRQFKPGQNKHLEFLILKTSLSQNTPNGKVKKFMESVRKVYKKLNKREKLQPILKIAAYSKELKIVFDFANKSVIHMDPTCENYTIGATDIEGDPHVLISAKGLLCGKKHRREVYKTIAHELTHFAVNVVHRNVCKPYHENDVQQKEKFSEIAEFCRKNAEKEKDVKFVIESYPQKYLHAELIVIIPTLMASIKEENKSTKLMKFEKNFPGLFQYYNEFVQVKLTEEFPLVEAKHEVKETNDLCGVEKRLSGSEVNLTAEAIEAFTVDFNATGKLIEISSNCPHLTLLSIFNQLRQKPQLEFSYVFAKLETLKNEKIFKLIVKNMCSEVKPTLVIDCDQQNAETVLKIVRSIKATGIYERLVFIINNRVDFSSETFTEVVCASFTHSWFHLTAESQRMLTQRKVNFQGHKISVEDIIEPESPIVKLLPLNALISNEEVVIGSEIAKLIFHVERKFLFPMEIVAKSFNDLFCMAEEQRVVVLADEPGMGKTTEFLVIANTLKNKFPSHWIVYVDLREFVGFYQRDGEIAMHFDHDSITTFLIERILRLSTSFEVETFREMSKNQRVILLIDGVNEICPNYKEFVMHLLVGIKNKLKHQLWVSSQSHLIEDLEKKLETQAVKLQPFTSKDQTEYYRKYLECKNIDQINFDRRFKQCKDFLKFNDENKFSFSGNISNPLLMKIVADLLDARQVNEISHVNFSSLYNEATRLMSLHFTNK